MKKTLAIMLALCLCLGVPFSGALKAVFGIVESFDNSLTKVGDTFGLDFFSGVGDTKDESETVYGLGYYTFQDERIPVWRYVENNILPLNKFNGFAMAIESVNPNVFSLEDEQTGVYYNVIRIRFTAVNPLTPFLPFRGYMYLDLEGVNDEFIWVSSSRLIPAKKVNIENGYTPSALTLVFEPHTAEVEQTPETVNQFIISLID